MVTKEPNSTAAAVRKIGRSHRAPASVRESTRGLLRPNEVDENDGIAHRMRASATMFERFLEPE